jgi:hypothetical protein
VAERFNQIVGVDVAGPLHETARGVTQSIVAVDYFSKWPEATAVVSACGADVCAFFSSWCARFGIPEMIVADRGSVFDCAQFREFCESRGIVLHLTAAYHHQANGQVERTIRTLKDILFALSLESENDWDLYLEDALFAMRTAVHEATRTTPAMAVMGIRPRGLAESLLHLPVLTEDYDPADEAGRAAHLATLREQIRAALETAARRAKRAYDARIPERNRTPTYSPGDLVMLKNMNRKNRRQRFVGPYRVTAVLPDGTFEIADADDPTRIDTVAADRLKHYSGNPEHYPEDPGPGGRP